MPTTNEDLLDHLIGLARSNPPGSDDQMKGLEANARDAVLARMRLRPNLNTDVTPEIVAMLDGSAAREDEAREVARLAAVLHADKKQWFFFDAVSIARDLLAESRRQVAEAQTKG